MSLEEAEGEGKWTREEDEVFETALADALPWKSEEEDEGGMRRWEELVEKVGTKTIEEIRKHYETLVDDISAIEAGKVEVPNYVGEEEEVEKEKGSESVDGGGGKSGLSKAEQERRKGIPWTEEEHKLFLLGLSKFGKGDWRSISRNYVISRTPTQVASHAQKYFIRLNSMNRDRRRSSIHDITSVNNGYVLSSPQTSSIGSSMKHPPPQPQVNMHGVGVYGVNHHMVSAVGTPVMLPSGHPGDPHSHPHPHPHHHPPYVVPMAYPIQPPPAMHQ